MMLEIYEKLDISKELVLWRKVNQPRGTGIALRILQQAMLLK